MIDQLHANGTQTLWMSCASSTARRSSGTHVMRGSAGKKVRDSILACFCQGYAGGAPRLRLQAPIPHFDPKSTGQGRRLCQAHTAKGFASPAWVDDAATSIHVTSEPSPMTGRELFGMIWFVCTRESQEWRPLPEAAWPTGTRLALDKFIALSWVLFLVCGSMGTMERLTIDSIVHNRLGVWRQGCRTWAM